MMSDVDGMIMGGWLKDRKCLPHGAPPGGRRK